MILSVLRFNIFEEKLLMCSVAIFPHNGDMTLLDIIMEIYNVSVIRIFGGPTQNFYSFTKQNLN